MKITLEQIDAIRERTGVSYSEAREALQLNDGDVVRALDYIHSRKGNFNTNETKNTSEENEQYNEYKECAKSALDTIRNLIYKGFEIRLLVSKHDRVKLDASLNILIVALIFAFPFTIAAGIIAFLTRHTLSIKSRCKDRLCVHYDNFDFKNIINVPKYDR